mgnify:FL=1
MLEYPTKMHQTQRNAWKSEIGQQSCFSWVPQTWYICRDSLLSFMAKTMSSIYVQLLSNRRSYEYSPTQIHQFWHYIQESPFNCVVSHVLFSISNLTLPYYVCYGHSTVQNFKLIEWWKYNNMHRQNLTCPFFQREEDRLSTFHLMVKGDLKAKQWEFWRFPLLEIFTIIS